METDGGTVRLVTQRVPDPRRLAAPQPSQARSEGNIYTGQVGRQRFEKYVRVGP